MNIVRTVDLRVRLLRDVKRNPVKHIEIVGVVCMKHQHKFDPYLGDLGTETVYYSGYKPPVTYKTWVCIECNHEETHIIKYVVQIVGVVL